VPALKRRRIKLACRSTLADANKQRAPAAFEALIPALLAKLSPAKARQAKDELRLIDSTVIHPGRGAQEWAHFQSGNIAAKVHLVYDPQALLPVFYELTHGNINDITVAKTHMPIEAGATYVFDLGYYDFGFWTELDRKQCRFVTRLKINTPVTLIEERAVTDAHNTDAHHMVRRDAIVMLPERQAKSRKNPFSKPGRIITVVIETGKTLRLFTNDLESSAQEIAALYKTRWQIELFFRWIKQNLKIRHFHGRSENAVKFQIIAAIITYLLLTILHTAAKTTKSISRFFTGLRMALFQRIELATLVTRIERRTKPIAPSPQLELIL
jgi:transposase